MGEIYDLAVRLSMQDGVSKVIGLLSSEVPVLGKHFEKLEQAALRTKVAIGGVGSILAGAALFKGLEHFEKAGEELVHVKTMFEAALPAADRIAGMAQVTAAAYAEAGKNMQSTIAGNVEAMHDLYNVTQSIDHATKLLPTYNSLANAFASVKNQESIGEAGTSRNIASAIRAFELTGRNTEEALAKASDAYVNTTIALGAKAITGGQLLTQISNSGDARYGWSDDFLTKILPAMIATGLQNRAGSALYAGSTNLYGGVSSSLMQGKFQEKWGLHSEADELIDNGKFRGFKVGSIWGADVLRENPLAWANAYREKLHDEFGVNVQNAKQMADIIGEIARGNKGLKSLLDELLLPQTNQQLNKETGNINGVGPDARDIVGANDPGAVHRALMAKWKDANDALGEQLVQPMLDNIIKPMTRVLNDVAQFAGAHPELVKEIGRDLLFLSGGLVAVGAALLTGALLAALGPAGWLVLGIGALSVSLAALENHNLLGPKSKLAEMLKGFEDAVNGTIATLIAEIGTWPGRLGEAIYNFSNSIVQKFEDALKFLNPLSHVKYQGDPGFSNLFHPARNEFVPPSRPSSPKTIQVNASLNIDGRTFAQMTSEHLASLYEFPTRAPAFDGLDGWTPPDMQTMST